MKILKRTLLGVILAFTTICIVSTGCVHTPTVDPTTGQTNDVVTVDQSKLNIVKASMDTIGSAVFAKAIKNSPDHAAEISNYVRAVGVAFCAAKASGQFSPATLFPALETATQQFQANVPPEIIIAKNGVKTLYQALFDDKLTVKLADNQWPAAVCDVICSSVNQALLDAGQPGVK